MPRGGLIDRLEQDSRGTSPNIWDRALQEIREVLASNFEACLQALLEQEKIRLEKQYATRLQEKDKKIASQRKVLHQSATKLREYKTQIASLKQDLQEQQKAKSSGGQKDDSQKVAGLRAALHNQQKCIARLKARLEGLGLDVQAEETPDPPDPDVLALQKRIAQLEKTIKAQNYHIEGQRNLILGYQEQYENTRLPWDNSTPPSKKSAQPVQIEPPLLPKNSKEQEPDFQEVEILD